MDLIQKATRLGYKHYSEFTIEELDKLSLNSLNKQIEYYLIQKWLREVHNLEVISMHADDFASWYKYKIRKLSKVGAEIIKTEMEFKSYEEALEEGLQESLKLIK